MIIDKVHTLMTELGLKGALTAFETQTSTAAYTELAFADRLEHLLIAERFARDERQRRRLLAFAKLKYQAHAEDIRYDPARGLDKAQIAELVSCNWVMNRDNLIISGATGSGKTWLACALSTSAIRQGLSVRYLRTNVALEEMRFAHLDGSISKLRASLTRVALVVLDDFGIAPLPATAKEDLFELLDARSEVGSTLVVGQLAPQEWHAYLDAPHIADGITDRLVQRAHRLELHGGSLRERHAGLAGSTV